MDDVDLRDLRVFLVCAEELHFGRAAQRLNLTPGRVSQTVAKLERRLGGQLFARTSRRVALTAYGASVRDEVGPAFEALLAAVRGVVRVPAEVGGTLCVGLYGMAWGSSLVPILAGFRARHPRCAVTSTDLGLDDPLGRLAGGEVDVVAAYLPVRSVGLAVGPVLSCDTRRVLLAADHPLAARPDLVWDDLADFAVAEAVRLPPEVREVVVPRRTPSGRVLRHTVAVTSFVEVIAAVAGGEIVHPTIASFADYVGHPGVVSRPLVDAEPMRAAVIYRDGPPSAAVAAFLVAAAEIAA